MHKIILVVRVFFTPYISKTNMQGFCLVSHILVSTLKLLAGKSVTQFQILDDWNQNANALIKQPSNNIMWCAKVIHSSHA